MEMRTRVSLSSSWEARGDLNAVLYIVSSSGSLLDEPLPLERSCTPLSLCAPTSDPDRPCQLQVDLSSVRGYISSQLELTSTSRTTELYQGEDDYVGTSRGSEAGNCSTDGTVHKLYCCDHNLPSDSPHQRVTIKLLSLRGKREVLIDKIQLVVTENHGGAVTPPAHGNDVYSGGGRFGGTGSGGFSGGGGGQLDMHQLLGSLPVDSLPPFMQTLVSSLSHLTTQVKTESGAQEDKDESRPAELSQVIQTLRQLRPSSAVKAKATDHIGTTETHSENGSDDGQKTGTVDGEDSRIVAIEERLKHYIDDKFEQLERKLEKRLQDLFSNQLQYHPNSQLLHLPQDENLD